MDFPPIQFAYPVAPAGSPYSPENQTAPSGDASRKYTNHSADERPSPRIEWVSKIIDAQASRVVHDTHDAIELKPVTIESQPSVNVRRFLEVAVTQAKRGSVIDTYA